MDLVEKVVNVASTCALVYVGADLGVAVEYNKRANSLRRNPEQLRDEITRSENTALFRESPAIGVWSYYAKRQWFYAAVCALATVDKREEIAEMKYKIKPFIYDAK